MDLKHFGKGKEGAIFQFRITLAVLFVGSLTPLILEGQDLSHEESGGAVDAVKRIMSEVPNNMKVAWSHHYPGRPETEPAYRMLKIQDDVLLLKTVLDPVDLQTDGVAESAVGRVGNVWWQKMGILINLWEDDGDTQDSVNSVQTGVTVNLSRAATILLLGLEDSTLTYADLGALSWNGDAFSLETSMVDSGADSGYARFEGTVSPDLSPYIVEMHIEKIALDASGTETGRWSYRHEIVFKDGSKLFFPSRIKRYSIRSGRLLDQFEILHSGVLSSGINIASYKPEQFRIPPENVHVWRDGQWMVADNNLWKVSEDVDSPESEREGGWLAMAGLIVLIAAPVAVSRSIEGAGHRR